jgi:hypothetical protein
MIRSLNAVVDPHLFCLHRSPNECPVYLAAGFEQMTRRSRGYPNGAWPG